MRIVPGSGWGTYEFNHLKPTIMEEQTNEQQRAAPAESTPVPEPATNRKSKKGWVIAIAVIVILIILGIVIF